MLWGRPLLAVVSLGAMLAACGSPTAPSAPAPFSAAIPPSAAAVSPAPSPLASTTGRIVTWLGATPTPFATPTPAPVPPGTPACTASGVTATVGWQGATGSMVGWLAVTNTGPVPCSLSGPPRLVSLRDGDVALDLRYVAEAAADAGVAGTAPATLLQPGGVAGAMIVWTNLCSAVRPTVTAVLVTLPGGGGAVPASATGPGFTGEPRCDVPGSPSTLTAYAFAPAPAEAPSPEPQPAGVSLAVPYTVAAGALLDYLVTLTNLGPAAAPLDPCPSFTEDLIVRGAALKPPGPEQYLLPCADIGTVLRPGESVTMMMRYAVPAGVAAGQVQLLWGMDPGGPFDATSASARAWLTVAGN